jgi:hypothetical protein
MSELDQTHLLNYLPALNDTGIVRSHIGAGNDTNYIMWCRIEERTEFLLDERFDRLNIVEDEDHPALQDTLDLPFSDPTIASALVRRTNLQLDEDSCYLMFTHYLDEHALIVRLKNLKPNFTASALDAISGNRRLILQRQSDVKSLLCNWQRLPAHWNLDQVTTCRVVLYWMTTCGLAIIPKQTKLSRKVPRVLIVETMNIFIVPSSQRAPLLIDQAKFNTFLDGFIATL